MPHFLPPSELERWNNEHAAKIKLEMQNFLTNQATADTEEPEDAAAPAAANASVCGSMLSFGTGSDQFELSIEAVMSSTDEQHTAVLKKPWFVQERSNRDCVLARHIMDHADALLKRVPLRCEDFHLLPEQRLSVLAMITPLPKETFCELKITRTAMDFITKKGARKQGFLASCNIEKNALPVFTITDSCTGSGKTIVALMAALVLLCDTERWDAFKANYISLLRTRVRENHSGLCIGSSTETEKVARVAVIFAPSNMLSHWVQTAQSAVFGAQEIYGHDLDILVWRGESAMNCMRYAYECDKPILWVLPLDNTTALRQAPEIGACVRIFDELNVKAITRTAQKESTCIYNFVTQATIESLETSTVDQPRHPLRLAFGQNFMSMKNLEENIKSSVYNHVDVALQHFSKMKMFATPEFIRRLVARGVQSHMPKGIVVQKLTLRARTLNAVATGSDLLTVSLADLAVLLLGKLAEKHSTISISTKDAVRGIFEKAESYGRVEILNELDGYIESMSTYTSHATQQVQAVKRLKNRFAQILEGELPSCPKTLKPIAKENICILKCCTAVLDNRVLAHCNKKCPLCCAPLCEAANPTSSEPDGSPSGNTIKELFAANPTSPSFKRKRDDDSDLEPPAQGRVEAGVEADRQLQFERTVRDISNMKMASLDGVTAVINAAVQLKHAPRILLCFGFGFGGSPSVSKICDHLRCNIADSVVADVESWKKDYLKAEGAKAKFNDPSGNPFPMIFVVNTTTGSSSMQGHNLHSTDLAIIADSCSAEAQRQACGRFLRMQRRPQSMAETDRFPAKRVVVASIN
jgi:hypothetical protein